MYEGGEVGGKRIQKHKNGMPKSPVEISRPSWNNVSLRKALIEVCNSCYMIASVMRYRKTGMKKIDKRNEPNENEQDKAKIFFYKCFHTREVRMYLSQAFESKNLL